MTVFAKDPASTVDYSVDWSDWLASDELITNTLWDIVPIEPLGLVTGVEQAGSAVRSVTVSGGVAGNVYRLACTISTDAGRTVARGMTIRCLER